MSDQETTHEQHDDHDHEHGHGGYALFIQVAIALVVLTAASYWTFTPFWPFGDSVEIKRLWMMAVSCCKASLVILVFMHLWWEANWKWVLTVPASIMCVFLTLALVPDIGMRLWNGYSGYSRERLLYAAELLDEEPQTEVDVAETGDGDDHHEGH